MIGITAPMTCPLCGGDIELVTTGRTTPWSTCGLTRCTECRNETVVRITLHAAGKRATEGAERQRKWRARQLELTEVS